MDAPTHQPALTPTQARQLWDTFSPRHRTRVREKMDGNQMMLHQVLNRFKFLRQVPHALTAKDPP